MESEGSVPDAHEVAAALRVAIGMVYRRLRQSSPNDELTLAESSTLSRLERGGPASSSELARYDRISPQSMGVTVAALEDLAIGPRLACARGGVRVGEGDPGDPAGTGLFDERLPRGRRGRAWRRLLQAPCPGRPGSAVALAPCPAAPGPLGQAGASLDQQQIVDNRKRQHRRIQKGNKKKPRRA